MQTSRSWLEWTASVAIQNSQSQSKTRKPIQICCFHDWSYCIHSTEYLDWIRGQSGNDADLGSHSLSCFDSRHNCGQDGWLITYGKAPREVQFQEKLTKAKRNLDEAIALITVLNEEILKGTKLFNMVTEKARRQQLIENSSPEQVRALTKEVADQLEKTRTRPSMGKGNGVTRRWLRARCSRQLGCNAATSICVTAPSVTVSPATTDQAFGTMKARGLNPEGQWPR